jgi:hypothetical protein
MTEVVERLEAALQQSLLPDQSFLDESTAFISAVQSAPDGPLPFLAIIAQTTVPTVRTAAIVNLYSLLKSNLPSIPTEIQASVRSHLLTILESQELESIDFSVLADCGVLLFAAMIAAGEFWNEMIRLIGQGFLGGKIWFTIGLLSRIILVIPDHIIAQSYAAFRNMAYSGLNSESLSVCFDACQIFLKIARVITEFEILNPIVSFLDNEARESESFDDDDFRVLWGTISEVVGLSEVPTEVILQFFSTGMALMDAPGISIERRTIVLEAFVPVLPAVEAEFAGLLISLSLDLSVGVIASTGSLPDLAIVTRALTTRSQTEVVPLLQQAIPSLLAAGDGPRTVLAVALLGPLLQFAQVHMASEVDFVRDVLTKALSSESELVQRAGLRVCNIMDESSSAYLGLIVDLLKLVVNLFTVESEQVRVEAFHAFLTLSERPDSQVDGLFEEVWRAQSGVRDTEMNQYIQTIGVLVRLSREIHDDQVGQLIVFLDTISQMGVPERSAGLSIIAGLLTKREGLFETLMPRVGEILGEAIAFDNIDVPCQALAFVQNLIKTVPDSVSFISPAFEFITGALDQDPDARVFRVALGTAATIIKFSGDTTLLDPALSAVRRMLESDPVDSKISACENLALFAKAVPVDIALLTDVANIVESEIDTDLLTAALEALSKLLRGHPEYAEVAERLAENIFSGNIKWLKGSIALLYDSPASITQSLLEFLSIFIRFHPSNLDQICEFVIEWMQHASPLVMTSILGLLTDAVLFCKVNPDIVVRSLEFLESLTASISDTDLRHNVVAYLSAVIGTVDRERVSSFLPAVTRWLTDAKGTATGHDLLISNIALFVLKISVDGPAVERALLLEAIAAFPPSDIKDTTEMARILIQILERDNSVDLVTASLRAIADLLTEPQGRRKLRKLPEDVLVRLQQLFTDFLAGQEALKQAVLSGYDGNQEKQTAICRYFV